MEKICIVKLRKRMTNPVDVQKAWGERDVANEDRRLKGLSLAGADNRCIREIDDGSFRPDDKKDAADRTVLLMLTQDQTRALRTNPHIVSFLSTKSAEGSEALRDRDGTIVVKFEFGSIPPMRLLKVEEVIQMLRISRSYLNKLVRQGKLKSYKLGRLRRLILDDILSYLEGSRELTSMRQQDSESKIIQKGTA
ncbi:MAG: helix-turn-helix domain-containing protein [Deltaproteobacteria bacterium]|nr:helix-turn-helix domain-containing protein [Deltaproteobacteria bacterium]